MKIRCIKPENTKLISQFQFLVKMGICWRVCLSDNLLVVSVAAENQSSGQKWTLTLSLLPNIYLIFGLRMFIILVHSPKAMMSNVWYNIIIDGNYSIEQWEIWFIVSDGPNCCCAITQIIGNIGGGWDNYNKSNHRGNFASSHSLITDNEHFYRGLCVKL